MIQWTIHAVYSGNKTHDAMVEATTLINALFLGKKRWPNADTIVCTASSGKTDFNFPATLTLARSEP